MQKYKATGNLTLFDEEERQQRLSKIGNPLEKLSKVIDFEMFRNELEDAVLNKEKKSRAIRSAPVRGRFTALQSPPHLCAAILQPCNGKLQVCAVKMQK